MFDFHWTAKRFEYLGKVIRNKLTNDKRYLTSKFEKKFKRKLNLITPTTFNEKVICRMLYSDNTDFTRFADKVRARQWVAETIGERYLVPVIGIYKGIKEIDFAALPNKFVLKCSHDSASALICTDKRHFSIRNACNKLRFCIKRNMYYTTREKHYKSIKPKIICEQYVDLFEKRDKAITPELYRVHCFSGIVRFIEVDFTDEQGKESVNIYNDKWEIEPVTVGYPNNLNPAISRPRHINKLIMLSEKLSATFDYCRVDWFMVEGLIYFSEVTFTPCAGRMCFEPAHFDTVFGRYWVFKKETE